MALSTADIGTARQTTSKDSSVVVGTRRASGGGGIGGDLSVGIGERDRGVDGVGDPPTHLPGTDDQ